VNPTRIPAATLPPSPHRPDTEVDHVPSPAALGRRPLRWRTLGAVVAVLVAAAGCGRHADADSRSGLETTRITIAAGPIADLAPIHLAMQHGLFKDEGLDVQLKSFASGAAATAALVGGQIEVSFGNYGSILLARQGGQDLRIVGEASTAATGTISVIALPTSKVRTATDLTGKKIAVTSLQGTPTAIVSSALRNAGVDPKTVKYVAVPLPGMSAALSSGAVDAAYVLEPYVTLLGKQFGARKVLDPISGQNAGLALNGYAMTGTFTKANPKTVAAFQRALAKAQALATRDAVQKILPKFTKIDPATAQLMALPEFPTTVNPIRIQRVADLMLADGQLKKPLKVAEFTVVPGRA
jgi:NitT/TauT family transport system substrate-binding protein